MPHAESFSSAITIHTLEIKLVNNNYRTLNKAIGIMLTSYTNAINRQEQRSGSLFRQNTKIEDGWVDDVITANGKHKKYFFADDLSYGRICFEYIHNNPVKAGIVKHQEDWEYSSAKDYKGFRNGKLCNQDLARKLLL